MYNLEFLASDLRQTSWDSFGITILLINRNMMLVALAAALLLVNYIRKYRGDNQKRVDSPDSISSLGVKTNQSTESDSKDYGESKDFGESTAIKIHETRGVDHGVSELWRRISMQGGRPSSRSRTERIEVGIQDEGGVPISY
jgi:hypothetical protein